MKPIKYFFISFLITASLPIFAQQISAPIITGHHYFDKLPSASGVEIYNGKIYLIADDLPWLFELDYQWNVVNKYPVSSNTQVVNGRTPKKIKSDFESMALVKQDKEAFMLIISSGSKKVKRDTAFLFSMNSKKVVTKKNLRTWFEKIKQKANMDNNDEINIEGTAVSNGNIYVLHRGNISGNFMVVSPLNDFLNFLFHKTTSIPPVKVYKFNLPSQKGVSAGLSGVCSLPNNKGLLVTASLEATSDVVNDGTILGSYLGYVPFSGLNKGIIKLTPIKDNDGKMIQKKQEGIEVSMIDKAGNYLVITVCDNDDGSSDIFQMQFKIK